MNNINIIPIISQHSHIYMLAKDNAISHVM